MLITRSFISNLGLLVGLIAFAFFIILDPASDMSSKAWLTAGVAILMTVWWTTEAVPIYVTGILPLIIFPLLNIFSLKEIASAYSHPLVLLFLGGFIIAAAMEACGLHKRIALKILSFFGTSPSKIIAGFMATTCLLSMWVSNTASTIMMLPIASSVIIIFKNQNKLKEKSFAVPLLLAIAYSASIGGAATLIGTPTNIMLASILSETYNYQISFIDWFLIGFPIVLVLIPLVWLFLSKIIFKVSTKSSPDVDKTISTLYLKMGKATNAEKVVSCVFLLTATLWISRRFLNEIFNLSLNDTSIGLLGALLLFVIPTENSKRACDWETANKIPWGVLLLVGGGIALSRAFKVSGLAEWIGTFSIYLNGLNIYLLILVFVLLIVFLTELNSNTATVATFTPILIIFAIGLEFNPIFLVIPTTIAASCAFMLPIATPPNAVVFGSGQIKISDMIKSGAILNLVAAFIVTFMGIVILNIVFDYSISDLPYWAKE